MDSNKPARHIHSLLLFTIIISSVLIILRGIAPAQQNTGWSVHESPTMGFSVEYPSDWRIFPQNTENEGKRVLIESPDASVSFAVIRGASFYSEERGRKLTYEELIEEERRRGNVSGLTSDLKEERFQLDGNPATLIAYTEYRARAREYDRTSRIYEKNHNTIIYFTIVGYDQTKESTYTPILGRMLASFKFQNTRLP